jgi:hypothetical protein
VREALSVGGETSEGKGLVERAGSPDGAPHIDVGCTGGNDGLAEPKSGCFIETLTKVADLAHFAGKTYFTDDNKICG